MKKLICLIIPWYTIVFIHITWEYIWKELRNTIKHTIKPWLNIISQEGDYGANLIIENNIGISSNMLPRTVNSREVKSLSWWCKNIGEDKAL